MLSFDSLTGMFSRRSKILSRGNVNVVLIEESTCGDYRIPTAFLRGAKEGAGYINRHLKLATDFLDPKKHSVMFVNAGEVTWENFKVSFDCNVFTVHNDIARPAIVGVYPVGGSKMLCTFAELLAEPNVVYHNWLNGVSEPMPMINRQSIYNFVGDTQDAVVLASPEVLRLLGVKLEDTHDLSRCEEVAREITDKVATSGRAYQRVYFINGIDALNVDRFIDLPCVTCTIQVTFGGLVAVRNSRLAVTFSTSLAIEKFYSSCAADITIEGFPLTNQHVFKLEKEIQ
ncbi:MAG: hypothetical protein ACRDBQ_18970 [Shewanella sp.]